MFNGKAIDFWVSWDKGLEIDFKEHHAFTEVRKI